MHERRKRRAATSRRLSGDRSHSQSRAAISRSNAMAQTQAGPQLLVHLRSLHAAQNSPSLSLSPSAALPSPLQKANDSTLPLFHGQADLVALQKICHTFRKKPSLLQPSRDPHRLPSVRARLEEQIGQVDFRVARSATRSASAPQISWKRFPRFTV